MREDIVPGTDYIIYQNEKGFCYSLDSLLLINFANLKGKVVDLGAGTGILSILATTFKGVKEVVSVEILKDYAQLLEKTVDKNELSHIITVKNVDINQLKEFYPSNYFDNVVMNPPYYKNSLKNKEDIKTKARHEEDLENFVSMSKYLVKNSGKVYIVYPVHRLVDVIALFREYDIEPKRIAFIKKNEESEPYAFLMEGAKSGGIFLKIEKDLVLYEKEGKKAEVLNRIYEVR